MRNPFEVGDRAHSLRRVVSSCVCDYSACALNSYKGSGNFWRNLAENDASPPETDVYSEGGLFVGGGAGTVPTLQGIPGNKGTGFKLDGSDFFYHSGLDDSSPQIIGDTNFADFWHRDQPFTVVIAMSWVSSNNQTLFATKAPGVNIGLIGFTDASKKLSVTQRGDTNVTTVASTAALSAGLNLVSIDHSFAANTTGFRVNTSTREAVAQTFNACTVKATTPLMFCSSINAEQSATSLPMVNNSIIYGIALFNDIISDVDFEDIKDAINARNGLTFFA